MDVFNSNPMDKIVVNCLSKLRLRRQKKADFYERRLSVALRDVSRLQDRLAYG